MSLSFVSSLPLCNRGVKCHRLCTQPRPLNQREQSLRLPSFRPRAVVKQPKQNVSIKPTRIAVLVSGGGRSLENLCEHITRKLLTNVSICTVIASKPTAGAIGIAESYGLPVHVLSAKEYPSNGYEYSDAITEVLDACDPSLVVMAGWMYFYRIPTHLAGKVLNIHPSLIPAFCGKGYYGNKVHRAAVCENSKSATA